MVGITLFGDSICNGYGVSLCDTWSVKLSNHLKLVYDNKVRLMNSSVDGRTTRQALLDMPYHIQSHPPDVLIVQFGMNDCNYWKTDNGVQRVSPCSFEANLFEIIDRAYRFGVKYVILNTNHPTLLLEPINEYMTYQDSNKEYNNIIRSVANNTGTHVVLNDIEESFTAFHSTRALLLPKPDLLHPSTIGHKVYFDVTQRKLEEVLHEII